MLKQNIRTIWVQVTSRRYGCGVLLISNLLLLAVIGLLTAADWYLPAYVGNRLLPQVTAAAGIKGVSAQVRRIGLTGADLADVRLELDGTRVLEVDSLRVDYILPWRFWNGELRITALDLSGVKIKAVWKDGQFRIPGIYPELMAKKTAAAESSAESEPSRLRLEEIRLSRGVFQIETETALTEIPFTLAMRQNRSGMITCGWAISCGEDRGDGTLEWQQNDGHLKIKCNGVLHPKRYAGLLPGMQHGDGPGNVKYEGMIEVSRLHDTPQLFAQLEFPSLKLATHGWTFGNVAAAVPVKLQLDGQAGTYHYRFSNLAVSGPAALVLDRAGGRITVTDDAIRINGKLQAHGAAGAQGGGAVQLASRLMFDNDYQFNWSLRRQWGDWHWQGQTRATAPGGAAIQATIGGGRLEVANLNWKADGDCGIGRAGMLFGATAELSLQPEARWTKNADGNRQTPLSVTAEVPTIKTNLRLDGGQLSGHVTLFTAALKIMPLGLRGSRINLDFPLQTGATPGALKVENILLNGRHLADIAMKITRQPDGLALDGSLKQDFLPGADWHCRACLAWRPYGHGELALEVAPYTPPEPLDLGRYWPGLAGMTFNGRIAGGFKYRFGGGVMGGEAAFQLQDGTIQTKKNELAITGIDAQVRFPSLPALQTPPSQRLACRELRMGKYLLRDAEVTFQLDADGALLLENLSAGWCGGRLYSHSLRIKPGQQTWQATIYCEGLELAPLIRELGIAEAEGTGAVHGRIPVTFGAGGIYLQPGFLYSVPGEKNQLRLRAAETVMEGIPPETPAYSQLDLAVEALKSFDYAWTRLNFRTEGDELKVEVQLDGKPTRVLPFTVRRGEFIRVNGPGARFEGIQLDIHLSVPLNRLLDFNQRVQNILRGKVK